MRSQTEIDEQLDRTYESTDEGITKWHGMTYEEGVQYALLWVTGGSNDVPMED